MTAEKLLMIGCLHLASIMSYPQAGSYPLGARAMGTGHCSLATRDFWGIFNNQAATARLEEAAMGIFLENRYMVKEMNRIALGGMLRAGKGMLLGGLDHFGGFHYSEMKAGLGYAMPFGDRFAAALQIDFLLMAVGEGYQNHHAITFEGGICADITQKLSVGMHVFNPVHACWNATEQHIAVAFRGGVAYRPEPSLTLCSEIQKSSSRKAVFAAGCEYSFRDRFWLRTGITTGEARYTFGAGLAFKRLTLDVASSMHTYLGFSPQLSFTYSLQR